MHPLRKGDADDAAPSRNHHRSSIGKNCRFVRMTRLSPLFAYLPMQIALQTQPRQTSPGFTRKFESI